MTDIRIGCVVEGHGDREAVPILVRRIAKRVLPGLSVSIPQAIRIPKSRLLKSGELERAVELTARGIGGRGGILVLVDSDDDCPAALGPELLRRAVAARGDLPIAVVLAKREFESWFLASAASLRGHRDLSPTLQPAPDAEAIRGAKQWLTRNMVGGHIYVETLDQPALAAVFDLDAARHADSFDKLFRETARLLGAVP